MDNTDFENIYSSTENEKPFSEFSTKLSKEEVETHFPIIKKFQDLVHTKGFKELKKFADIITEINEIAEMGNKDKVHTVDVIMYHLNEIGEDMYSAATGGLYGHKVSISTEDIEKFLKEIEPLGKEAVTSTQDWIAYAED